MEYIDDSYRHGSLFKPIVFMGQYFKFTYI
jgi:hypothetical protein